jgi:hypothetical protein
MIAKIFSLNFSANHIAILTDAFGEVTPVDNASVFRVPRGTTLALLRKKLENNEVIIANFRVICLLVGHSDVPLDAGLFLWYYKAVLASLRQFNPDVYMILASLLPLEPAAETNHLIGEKNGLLKKHCATSPDSLGYSPLFNKLVIMGSIQPEFLRGDLLNFSGIRLVVTTLGHKIAGTKALW